MAVVGTSTVSGPRSAEAAVYDVLFGTVIASAPAVVALNVAVNDPEASVDTVASCTVRPATTEPLDESVEGGVTVTGTWRPAICGAPAVLGRAAVPVTVTVAPSQPRLAEAVAAIVGEQAAVVT